MGQREMKFAVRRCETLPTILTAACFFNCLNNNSSRFFSGKIGNRQVRDRLAVASPCFGINRNLANLYRYPWRATINDSNFFIPFLVFGQISPPPKMVRLCPRSDDFKSLRTAPGGVSEMNQQFLFSVSSTRPHTGRINAMFMTC